MLQYGFLGFTIKQLLFSFLILLGSFVVNRLLSYLINAKLMKLAERTKTELDELVLKAINKPLQFLVFLIALLMIGMILALPKEPTDIRKIYLTIVKTLIAIDIAWFLMRGVDVVTYLIQQVTQRTESRLDDQLVPVLKKTLQVFIAIIAFILILQNLGYSVTSLVTGLGIGGLAIALAAQETLSNVFASIMILLDRPFIVGDWIVAGDVEGVVEEIGLRSTRIRTFPKTLVTIPNNVLVKQHINNFSSMPKRRVVITVGVTYETTAEQMEKAVEKIKGIIGSHPEIDHSFYVVRFTEFGDSSLNIMVYYFTRPIGYADHLKIREDVNLAIMRALEELGLEIAFPSRTIYIRETGKPAPQPLPDITAETKRTIPEDKNPEVSGNSGETRSIT